MIKYIAISTITLSCVTTMYFVIMQKFIANTYVIKVTFYYIAKFDIGQPFLRIQMLILRKNIIEKCQKMQKSIITH